MFACHNIRGIKSSEARQRVLGWGCYHSAQSHALRSNSCFMDHRRNGAQAVHESLTVRGKCVKVTWPFVWEKRWAWLLFPPLILYHLATPLIHLWPIAKGSWMCVETTCLRILPHSKEMDIAISTSTTKREWHAHTHIIVVILKLKFQTSLKAVEYPECNS